MRDKGRLFKGGRLADQLVKADPGQHPGVQATSRAVRSALGSDLNPRVNLARTLIALRR